MFANQGWTLAEDHINFALGKHSFHLGDLETAVSYFTKLLKNSQQPPAQQVAYLREFLFIYRVGFSMDLDHLFIRLCTRCSNHYWIML
jgi:hypothetical protein